MSRPITLAEAQQIARQVSEDAKTDRARDRAEEAQRFNEIYESEDDDG